VTPLIAALQQEGWQSDERFAEHYVASRVERGYGPVRIARELEQRGVAAELIDRALGQEEQFWHERAAQVHHRRFGGVLPENERERARQARFLQYRGFTMAQIRAAWESVTARAG